MCIRDRALPSDLRKSDEANAKLEFVRKPQLSGEIESSKADYSSDDQKLSNDSGKTENKRLDRDVKLIDNAFENDINLDF